MVLFFVFSFLIGGSSSFCFFLLPLSMFSSTFSVSFFLSIFTKTDKGVGHHFISRNLALIDASLGSEGCHALGLS